MSRNTESLVGKRFERLLVIERAESIKKGGWLCRCDCGTVKVIRKDALVNGVTRSCSCLNREINLKNKTTHGDTKSPEHTAYISMRGRCYNKNAGTFKYYGGKGVVVCDRWLHSYSNFLADMGRKPSPKHSLERKDVNGNYCPENCKWATKVEQANNKTSTRWITLNGMTKSMDTWCKHLCVNVGTVSNRLRFGWSNVDAFLTPISPKRKLTFRLMLTSKYSDSLGFNKIINGW